MKIARVTGTVTAEAKDPALVGLKLLVVDVIDVDGTVIEPAVVGADICGAGVGDEVLLVVGSAARIPAAATGIPVDVSIVAIIDRITVQN